MEAGRLAARRREGLGRGEVNGLGCCIYLHSLASLSNKRLGGGSRFCLTRVLTLHR
jgi:hypothetical protein